MKTSKLVQLKALFASVLFIGLMVGCTDTMFSEMGPDGVEQRAVEADTSYEGKLRHPQLKGLAGSASAGKDGADTHLFVAFNSYEADGVTPRLLDKYGVTTRILEEYGVTRRVLESYGITNRVLEQWGVTSRVLEAFTAANTYLGAQGITDGVLTQYAVTPRLLEEYGITNRVLEEFGITARVLDAYGNQITDALLREYKLNARKLEQQGVTARMLEDYAVTARMLEDYGVTPRMLEDFGITARMMEEYGITSRMLEEYDITARMLESYINAFTRTMRLKVRIENGVPGMFISLGDLSLETFLDEIGADTDIAYVELDVPVQGPAIAAVNDGPYRDELLPWGITHTGASKDAVTGVEVFVLDSGVYPHDLNVVEAKDFTGLFVNRDVHTWDDSEIIEQPFYDPGTAGNPDDETGHGTHVAGTIGALQNNEGIVGMAPGVNIHSLKVLTAQGQTDITTLMAAIDYVIAQKLQRPTTPMVINLSLGMDLGSNDYNVLDEAIVAATQNNISVVVSAGNSGVDAKTYSPAHVQEAITVGAIDMDNHWAAFSNTGSVVDILAPGAQIVSLSNDPRDANRGFAIVESGTSMAAPHVTGAVASFLARNPQATPQQVETALSDAAKNDVSGTPNGTTNRRLWVGRVDDESGGINDTVLPPFYQFAITAGNRIDVYQETSVWVGFEDPSSKGNASIFANQFLDLDNNYSVIKGFSYNGSAYAPGGDVEDPDPAIWATWMDRVVQPKYNPADLPGTQYQDPIEIPYLDVNAFKGQATVVTRKNLTLSGHYDLGTKENPMVWYVGGNVSTRGNVTFSGYGVFLVKGTFNISHSIKHAEGVKETTLGLYTNNGIAFKSDNLEVAAHIFTNSSVLIQRDLTLYGNITAKGNVSYKTQGANELYYREPPAELTSIFWN